MSDNDKLTSAEAYREARKKKESVVTEVDPVKKEKKRKHGIMAFIIIASVLVVALLTYSFGSLALNSFCSLQRVVSVGTVCSEKITAAEFNYYYMSLYNQMYEYSSYYETQYASYGEGMGAYTTGFDCALSPSEQPYSGEDAEELGENASWADYFKVNAPRRAALINILYAAAIENSYELTEEEKEEAETELDGFRETAHTNDLSLREYLFVKHGEGIDEEEYRELQLKNKLAMKYLNEYKSVSADGTTEDDVQKYFDEHPDDFKKVSFRAYSFEFDVNTSPAAASTSTEAQSETTSESETDDTESSDSVTYDEAVAQSSEMLAKLTDESSFSDIAREYAPEDKKSSFDNDSATLVSDYDKASLENTNTELAEWLYSSSRSVGDKTSIIDETNGAIHVVMITSLPKEDTTIPIDVRHILIKFETTDADGNTVELTDELKASAKATAEEVYNEWKDGAANEDSFAELVKTYSDDTGSVDNGGLYEGVTPGEMVKEFNDWCFDPSRQPGDTDIVETTYGYHIMYFSATGEEPGWKIEVKNAMASLDYDDYVEEVYQRTVSEANMNEKIVDYFASRTLNIINLSLPQGQ